MLQIYLQSAHFNRYALIATNARALLMPVSKVDAIGTNARRNKYMKLVLGLSIAIVLTSSLDAHAFPIGNFLCPNGDYQIEVKISEITKGWRTMTAGSTMNGETWLIEGPLTRIKHESKDGFRSDQLVIGGSTFKLNLDESETLSHPNDGRPCLRKNSVFQEASS
jgi:hypothetical protein